MKLKKAKSRKTDWRILVVSVFIVYLVAFVGSLFSSEGIDSGWYEGIKPSISPPDWVFPVVWNILFFLIALSLFFSWSNSASGQTKLVAFVFGLNFILNVLWSVLYFGLRNPFAAFIELIFLWLSILLMMFVAFKIDKKAFYLLVPYLLWVSFAGVLNWLSF